MNIPAHVQWLFDHKVGPLGDDEELLRAILSLRSWHVESWGETWSVCFGDQEAPYATGEAEAILDACVAALSNAVKWGETRHLGPKEVAFIEAVLAAREGERGER